MADVTTYRVVPRENGWAVEKEGASRATSVEDTKAAAVKQAKGHAQNQGPSRVIVHRADGTEQGTLHYDASGNVVSTPAPKAKAARKPAKRSKSVGRTVRHEMKVQGNQLLDRVKHFVEEGNVRHITIKREGRVLAEFPLAVGLGGAAAALLVAPALAAIGAIAALVSDVDIVVERDTTPEA